MPYVSHRSAEARTFDCLYDPNYIVPTERDALHATLSAADSAASVQVYAKYDVMFENAPKETRLLFRKQQSLPTAPVRLEGGANLPINRKLQKVIASAGACKSRSPGSGLYLFQPRPANTVNVINMRLNESPSQQAYDKHNGAAAAARVRALELCQPAGGADQPKRKRIISRTCGTQTLYRESSAQTLPYLPDVSNEQAFLDTLELFRLPTILPGDGPPGLYEVEVLERARKRWGFTEALKQNFQEQLEAAREQAKLPEHQNILEAFEWEHWIEREEYIQECQMLRLDLLVRMFDQREKEMHEKSKTRLMQRCEEVAAKREAGLRKNEVEYGRALRRLEAKRRNVPRNWRKENICKELGQPDSEYYAPQMRYGVNPNRRHFSGGSKAFEARMDDLEMKAVHMGKLVCPYAKLKEMAKPKEQMTEVEQNFCSEENLKKLYETMKNLREQSDKQKTAPKCLIEKTTTKSISQPAKKSKAVVQKETISLSKTIADEEENELGEKEPEDDKASEHSEYEKLRLMSEKERKRTQFLLNEKRLEELDAMVTQYEGTAIGWLMRFLREEMERLEEQRKLHFISMLAQRERWRREAAEAGLRQKENEMRQVYEQLYQDSIVSNSEASREYLDGILRTESVDYADDEATASVLALARLIDEDIQRWLTNFQTIQTPLNFDTLREILKDIVFPNADKMLLKYEAQQAARYVIDNALFPHLNRLLEPYDIGVAVANETVDRTFDTDLRYMSSSECSSDCDICPPNMACSCTCEKREASALMRKLVRYTVPGRRWKTSTERVALENVNDVLDEAFRRMLCKGQFKDMVGGIVHESPSHVNLMLLNASAHFMETDSSKSELQHVNDLERMKNIPGTLKENVTGDLLRDEHLRFMEDTEHSDDSNVLHYQTYKEDKTHQYPYRQVSAMKYVISAYDIMSIRDKFPTERARPSLSSSENSSQRVESDNEEMIDETTRRYLNHLLKIVVNTSVPADSCDSDLSEFQSGEEEEEQREKSLISQVSEDNAEGALRALLRNVFEMIPSESDIDYEPLSEHSGLVGEEAEPYRMNDEDEYFLEISESELDRMKQDRCKCEAEKSREAYVNEMLIRGRVRIKPKVKLVEDQEAEEEKSNSSTTLYAESLHSFEYDESEMLLKQRDLHAGTENQENMAHYVHEEEMNIRGLDVDDDTNLVLGTEEEDNENMEATSVKEAPHLETEIVAPVAAEVEVNETEMPVEEAAPPILDAPIVETELPAEAPIDIQEQPEIAGPSEVQEIEPEPATIADPPAESQPTAEPEPAAVAEPDVEEAAAEEAVDVIPNTAEAVETTPEE